LATSMMIQAREYPDHQSIYDAYDNMIEYSLNICDGPILHDIPVVSCPAIIKVSRSAHLSSSDAYELIHDETDDRNIIKLLI
jgi:hypothetical protein